MNFRILFNSSIKISLNIIFIVLILFGCLFILKPFILSFLWASMIVISTWPIFIKLKKILWNSYFLSVLSMIFFLLFFFILPVFIVIIAVFNNFPKIISWISNADIYMLSNLFWMKNIPIVGEKLFIFSKEFFSEKNFFLTTKLQPYVGELTKWIFHHIMSLGNLLINSILTIVFSTFLYIRGNHIKKAIKIFGKYVDAKKSEKIILLTVKSIRAVAISIVLASVIQTFLSAVGLILINAPVMSILIILIFIFSIAQLGALPVLIPIVIWLYLVEDNITGTILLVWSILVSVLDNILRPIFIQIIGMKIPILLVLCGVFGGLLSFGIIGIFLGPVILIISWHLFFNLIPIFYITKKRIN
ncbi:putative inner membrane protein [Wigglesworthia glossinidia endosymbiont of Glossina morsitans morsitans (Yale colony)]|uniref:Putative inner membrane protein n=1 Tax=Wigglesworthia glossinidia endosymbiont of Glossina morsitans morsitans (Yale colony) TaxID=1142511 RepID=H6Q4A6_WIGGL|nr:AI-2E family transporter YdiK [Wigglesworthia glossinidia]AFA40889.1 putative inner membrane protein [Wigglesworthia glossinidia endosymbiont of Glossina morsitans morsitans (Yale colony)]